MFEISGSEVTSLGDADLRSLVQRLAIAELRKQGCPLSSITAGGDQDAADGGLDVRVQCRNATEVSATSEAHAIFSGFSTLLVSLIPIGLSGLIKKNDWDGPTVRKLDLAGVGARRG